MKLPGVPAAHTAGRGDAGRKKNGIVTTKGKDRVLIENYLYSLGKISNAMTKGGNLIFAACHAGATPQDQPSLAMSVFNLLKCSNGEINVVMNTLSSTFYNPNSGLYTKFDSPLTYPGEGSPAWVVANKLSNTAQTGSGDITLNKTGSPVTFSDAIYRLLNR